MIAILSQADYEFRPDAAPRRRSNRPITQFACKLIDDFINNRLAPGTREKHNTSVQCSVDPKGRTVSVFLYETRLVLLTINNNDDPAHLIISVGDRFEKSGSPAQTVVERLNGILDTLGIHGVIPEGVRIFKDKEEGLSYIGKLDDKIAVGETFARNIIVKPDACNFLIESSDIDFNS